MCPVLHVEGLRTPPGICVVGHQLAASSLSVYTDFLLCCCFYFHFSLHITYCSPTMLCWTWSLFITNSFCFSLIFQSCITSGILSFIITALQSQTYTFDWFSPRLKDSLLGAVLTLSGWWFHFSTTCTANECFLMSVRAYWTPVHKMVRCGLSCPCPLVLLLAFSNRLVIWSSWVILYTSPTSCFCRLSSNVQLIACGL